MSFQLFEPFNVSIKNPNDIELYPEEEEVIEEEFFSIIPDSDLDSLCSSMSEEGFLQRLFESRGRNRLIESKPRLEEIIRAVEKRRYLSMYYEHRNGERGHRLIEPYVVGRGYKKPDGEIVNPSHVYIRGFVIMDSTKDKYTKDRFAKTKSVSVSDRENRWRLFRMDRILNLWDSKRVFSRYRRLYNPNDRQIGTILASLSYSSFPKGENPKINY